MTVSTSYAPLSFNGDDATTAFAVTWPFFDSSLVVTLVDSTGVETVKTITTHYTVSGGTDSDGLPATGTVTMLTAPASGETLRITRNTSKVQSSSWTNGGAYQAKTLEATLDKIILIAQETQAGINDDITGDVMQLNTSGATDYWDAEDQIILNVGTSTTADAAVNYQQLSDAVFNSGNWLGSTGAVDNAVLRANGTGGAHIQSSLLVVDDNGNASGANLDACSVENAASGSVSRTLQTKLSESFSVKDFGAIGDGAHHPLSERYASLAAAQAVYSFATALTQGIDWAAFQLALNAAATAGHRTVYIPSGTYYFDGDDPALTVGTGATLFGDGPLASILKFEEENGGATAKRLFYDVTGGGHVGMYSFQVQGALWDKTAQVGDYAWYFQGYTSVTMTDVLVSNIGCIGPIFQSCNNVIVTNNRFEDCARGAIRVTNARRYNISDNIVMRGGDDPFSVHVGNASLSSASPAIGESGVIANNIIIGCSGSIKAYGARVLSCTGNMLQLTHGIIVGADPLDGGSSVEGGQQPFAIDVSHNVLIDSTRMETGAAVHAIAIYAEAPRGATATNSTSPYQYDTTGTAFIFPWDWRDAVEADSDDALNPAFCITVSNNIITRTLPAIANVSNYGYGTMVSQGVALSSATTDATLRPTLGISLAVTSAVALSVCNNTIHTSVTAIQVGSGAASRNISVKDNDILDFTSVGIAASAPGGTETLNAVVEGNIINGDIFRAAANSAADGTYAANSTPIALNFSSSLKGVVFRANTFANVCQIIPSAALASGVFRDNIAYANVAALGFSTSNAGIGDVPNVDGIEIHTIDADPTSGTYFQSYQRLERAASSIPTSGWYPIGHFVRNLAPTTAGILGWLRLTTGTGHVSGTDWLVVYASTNMSTARLLGRTTAGTGRPEEITVGDGLSLATTTLKLAAGTVVNRGYDDYATHTGLTTAIPIDDTIPQNTEGTEILSVSITPKSASNILRWRFRAMGSAAAAVHFSAALFRDSGADAIDASSVYMNAANWLGQITMEGEVSAGSTSSTTFTVRVGPNAGTLYLNGSSASRFLGGVSKATLIIEEIVA